MTEACPFLKVKDGFLSRWTMKLVNEIVVVDEFNRFTPFKTMQLVAPIHGLVLAAVIVPGPRACQPALCSGAGSAVRTGLASESCSVAVDLPPSQSPHRRRARLLASPPAFQ